MIIGVPKESFPGEQRVALVPAILPSLSKAGCGVLVESGAGEAAFYPDAAYLEKGARIVASRAEVFASADAVFQVLAHGANDKTGRADLPLLKRNQVLIGFFRPLGSPETVQEVAAAGVAGFAVEFMPRITRAQSMDALSSMATVDMEDSASMFWARVIRGMSSTAKAVAPVAAISLTVSGDPRGRRKAIRTWSRRRRGRSARPVLSLAPWPRTWKTASAEANTSAREAAIRAPFST